MSAGYGRGYYGENQLAKAPRRRGSGWVKLALVVGVGAVIWLMWPRKAPADPWRDGEAPRPPQPPAPSSPEGQLVQASGFPAPQALPVPTSLPQQVQFAQPSQARGYLPPPTTPLPPPPVSHAQIAQPTHGYPSTKEYEDAVVASAKQLKESGAQVMLAPHLAHLASRLT